ncbi:MAG: hypothetical protein CSB24_00460 [Deltaproteobacteria bacterium]|nr:MAG: hypothetical protein CSB24_00460 [Deltaproteobacteria bacterium]
MNRLISITTLFLTIITASLSFADNGNKTGSELLQNRAESVSFDGKTYHLSWINVDGSNITNEYLIKGYNLENWQSMIASRIYMQARNLKEVLPVYVKSIKPYMANKPEFYKSEHIKSPHVIIEAFLLAPDKSYYEYNLHLFKETPKGVVAYQFAEKLPFKKELDVTDIVKSRGNRLDLLSKMELEFFKK